MCKKCAQENVFRNHIFKNENLALNTLQRLICHKTNQIKSTSEISVHLSNFQLGSNFYPNQILMRHDDGVEIELNELWDQ